MFTCLHARFEIKPSKHIKSKKQSASSVTYKISVSNFVI